jgi:hypothetical protein
MASGYARAQPDHQQTAPLASGPAMAFSALWESGNERPMLPHIKSLMEIDEFLVRMQK